MLLSHPIELHFAAMQTIKILLLETMLMEFHIFVWSILRFVVIRHIAGCCIPILFRMKLLLIPPHFNELLKCKQTALILYHTIEMT